MGKTQFSSSTAGAVAVESAIFSAAFPRGLAFHFVSLRVQRSDHLEMISGPRLEDMTHGFLTVPVRNLTVDRRASIQSFSVSAHILFCAVDMQYTQNTDEYFAMKK